MGEVSWGVKLRRQRPGDILASTYEGATKSSLSKSEEEEEEGINKRASEGEKKKKKLVNMNVTNERTFLI